jgi:predicted secreted Zn-dependent protease
MRHGPSRYSGVSQDKTGALLTKVTGGTVDELRKQMRDLGPVDKSGRHRDAYPDWHVDWSYRYDRSAGGCSLGSMNVTLTVVFTFPQWAKSSDAPASLVEKWDAFIRALTAHEDGHKSIALGTANDILLALGRLRQASTCEDLARTPNGEGQRLLREGEERHLRYDATTDHGATQGARLR